MTNAKELRSARNVSPVTWVVGNCQPFRQANGEVAWFRLQAEVWPKGHINFSGRGWKGLLTTVTIPITEI